MLPGYLFLWISTVCARKERFNESLNQSSIETIHERCNGINSLLVCLSEYLRCQCDDWNYKQIQDIAPKHITKVKSEKIYPLIVHPDIISCLVPLESKMANLSKFMSKLQKVRMDY